MDRAEAVAVVERAEAAADQVEAVVDENAPKLDQHMEATMHFSKCYHFPCVEVLHCHFDDLWNGA
jgi:hypothetical protein